MGLADRSARLRGWIVVAAGLALAGASQGAWADDPPEKTAPAVVNITEETAIEDFLVAIRKKLDVRLAWDPSTKIIRDKKILGGDLHAPAGRLLSLVRNMLVPFDLVMIPMGSEAERWYFIADAKQQSAVMKLKPEVIDLNEGNLAQYEGEDGLFVSTTIRVQALRNLRDARTALTKISTQNLGNVTEVPDGNAFVVTDFAPNVVAIYRLIRQLDVAPADASPARLVAMRHAKADNVARLLNAHFALPVAAPPNPQQAGSGPTASTGPRITSDARTNQLLIGGSPSEMQAVLKLIEGLDVPVEAAAPAAASAVGAHVIKIRNVRANDLVNVLQNVANGSMLWTNLEGMRPAFTSDSTGNLLVVAASERHMPAIRALVESLDVPSTPR